MSQVQVHTPVIVSEVDKILSCMLNTKVPIETITTEHVKALWLADGKTIVLEIHPYGGMAAG